MSLKNQTNQHPINFMLDTQHSIRQLNYELPILDFKKIHLEYPVKGQVKTIIDEVSFSIQSGEFISIVGPSGCGKTSLLSMVSGLKPPQQGTLLYRGTPITKPIKNVGIAFQKPVLLPWRTTLKNVLLPLEIVHPYKRKYRQNFLDYNQQAQELLATVGLDDFVNHYPWQLSGGMQQRASLCRALIHQPELLLLDEPFAALDAFTKEEMWVMLQSLWQKTQCTAILVTHDLREAIFLSDTVYVMSSPPSRIIYPLKINFPRPRTLDFCLTDEFNHLFVELRKQIQKNQ